MQARAGLSEEDGSAKLQTDQKRQHQEDGAEYQQAQCSQSEVELAFQDIKHLVPCRAFSRSKKRVLT